MVDATELKECELFADLDDRQLDQVAQTASLEKVQAGRYIFAENQRAPKLYLVVAGRVAIGMKSRRGQEVTVDELDRGELFGWSALLEGQPFTAGARALEDSTLVAFDGEALRKVLVANPLLGYRVMSIITGVVSSRLAHLRSRLVDEPFAPEWLLSPLDERQAATVVGATSEMRRMSCPDCGTLNAPRAIVNHTEQYRCRTCGMVYYSPAGCER
jgi:CRP/FNR family transcriptional regulator, cyclic AMP receptor protein